MEKGPGGVVSAQEGVGGTGSGRRGRAQPFGKWPPGAARADSPHACDFPCFLGILIFFSGKLPVP